MEEEKWRKLLEAVERPLFDSGPKARSRALFLRAALMVYGGGGLRLSEGCALRREDVEPSGRLSIGIGEETVRVEGAVIEAIQGWTATHDLPWVFPGKGGRPINPRTMQTAVTQLMKTAGIQDIRDAVHMLRAAPLRYQHRVKTLGSVGSSNGESIEDLKEGVKQLKLEVKDLKARLEALEAPLAVL